MKKKIIKIYLELLIFNINKERDPWEREKYYKIIFESGSYIKASLNFVRKKSILYHPSRKENRRALCAVTCTERHRKNGKEA